VEPLWTGPRVLAIIDGATVRLVDKDGQAIDGHEDVVDALRTAAGGATVLLEGFLTPEPIRAAQGIATRDIVTIPKPGQAMTQAVGQANRGGGEPPAAPVTRVGPGGPAPSAGTTGAAASACGACSKPVPAGSRFCPSCGAAQAATCPRCNARLDKPSKFCPECGAPQA